MKFLILSSIMLFSSLSFAQSLMWKSEVDALDVWEILSREEIPGAITKFKEKCSVEIIERTLDNLSNIGVNTEAFTLTTRSYKYAIRGYGDSYRCELTARIHKDEGLKFSKAYTSEVFRDIIADSGEVLESSVDQCKAYILDLESRAKELNLFSRNALVEWKKNRNGKYIRECFVKYTLLVQK